RIMGGYAGRTLPNEFTADGVLMGCCCGAGPRGLFLAWEQILTRRADGLYVNLHLNRFSREADVLSSLPHEGRIEIHMHSEGPLHVRLPSGAPPEQISVSRNGSPTPAALEAGFLRIEDALPGDVVTLHFPLQTGERREKLLEWDLQVGWRGDTVVS